MDEKTLVTDAADKADELIAVRSEEAIALHQARADAKRAADLAMLKIAPCGERICAVCSEPMNPRRLAALPDAVRCTECEASQGRRA
jgi:RNA polymerase-binding transcription factor DksA